MEVGIVLLATTLLAAILFLTRYFRGSSPEYFQTDSRKIDAESLKARFRQGSILDADIPQAVSVLQGNGRWRILFSYADKPEDTRQEDAGNGAAITLSRPDLRVIKIEFPVSCFSYQGHLEDVSYTLEAVEKYRGLPTTHGHFDLINQILAELYNRNAYRKDLGRCLLTDPQPSRA